MAWLAAAAVVVAISGYAFVTQQNSKLQTVVPAHDAHDDAPGESDDERSVLELVVKDESATDDEADSRPEDIITEDTSDETDSIVTTDESGHSHPHSDGVMTDESGHSHPHSDGVMTGESSGGESGHSHPHSDGGSSGDGESGHSHSERKRSAGISSSDTAGSRHAHSDKEQTERADVAADGRRSTGDESVSRSSQRNDSLDAKSADSKAGGASTSGASTGSDAQDSPVATGKVPAPFSGNGAFAAPNGTGTACSKASPCAWNTAMSSGEKVVILLDGRYSVPSRWTVPEGVTVVSYNYWGAHVAFTSTQEGHFIVHGAIKNMEITAPSGASAVDLMGANAEASGLFVHDVNTDDDYFYPYYKEKDTCAQQGAIDLASGSTLRNSIIYKVGVRADSDKCKYYHAVYHTDNNIVSNNLVFWGEGGFCIQGYKASDINNYVEYNTVIGCEKFYTGGAMVSYGGPKNYTRNNVISQSDGAIRLCCSSSITTMANAENNIFKESDQYSSYDVGITTDGNIGNAVVPYRQIAAEFDAADTPAQKIALARKYSMNRALTNGAGYVFTE